LALTLYSFQVTDFGVATDLNTSRNLTAETGTYRWMSPEVIRHEKYTQTADVYSFAVLVWQLITREEPFADRGQIEAAVAVSMESKRPGLPPGTPPTISGFLAKAWAEDPQTRPSFDVMSEMLAEIEAGLTTDEKRWLEAPLGHHVYNRVDDEEEETEGVEIKPMNLDDSKIPSKSKAKAKDGMKRGKKFSLFSRKSSHF
jgi:serine/threonine protein kinase